MKARYYVQPSAGHWVVLDRLRLKMHNDVVVHCATRTKARAKARELNDEEHRDHTADQQLTVDGELI